MKKIQLAHFKNNNKNLYVNGGKLSYQDSKIIIKCFLKTVVTFDTDTFNWKMLQNHIMGYKVILLSDKTNSYECLLSKKQYIVFQNEFINYKA